MSTQTNAQPPYIEIKARTGWLMPDWAELYAYRELLYFLAWRDIKVRYKQTVLGVAWAIIQPLLTMVVFTLFFGNLGNIPSDNIPYPIFSYAALVPWTYFATRIQQGSSSLVMNSNLIQKVYFPRLLIPISTVLAGVIDFLLSFIVLMLMMLFFGIAPTANVIFLPFFLLLALMTSLGVSLWLSAMNVQFRDVRYVVPFLVQLWLFITPIAYPSSLIQNETLRALYGINPMTGVVEGFRWALLGGATVPRPLIENDVINTLYNIHPMGSTLPAPGPVIIVSTGVALLLMLSGMMYFRRMEKTFADVI